MKSFALISFVSLSCTFIVSLNASNCCEKEIEYQFLEYIQFEHCEGKDGGNYTMINQFMRDSRCSRKSGRQLVPSLLLSCSEKSKQNNVNTIKALATSVNPNGPLENVDRLFLITMGQMEGKYVYLREIVQSVEYLKVCSSILGYSYVNSKSSTLLISDKLDLNILISPTGAFELFKKGCTTVCHGSSIIVGPTDIITVRD